MFDPNIVLLEPYAVLSYFTIEKRAETYEKINTSLQPPVLRRSIYFS
jgi:hypothetical protein